MGTVGRNEFFPDWTSPPTDTIKDLMVYHNLDRAGLAKKMDVSRIVVDNIFDRELYIDYELAEKLSGALGGSISFWVNRQIYYLHNCRRLNLEP